MIQSPGTYYPEQLVETDVMNKVHAMKNTPEEKKYYSPDELNKELPYVENHINYTRLAYGLDSIEEKSF